MEFTEYRSQALEALRPRTEKSLQWPKKSICRSAKFSTWEVDNICANCWRADNPIGFCTAMLFDYCEELLKGD